MQKNVEAIVRSAEAQLESFSRESSFWERGAIITDLDGTAVHEFQDRIVIVPDVANGLKRLVELRCPLILNTLRFPMSVLRTFGREWYSISKAPIPTVTLNGSQLGYIVENGRGELEFEEIDCKPLPPAAIEHALAPVKSLLAEGHRDVLVFYYPRDWKLGEVIWTPVAENVMHVKQKYKSASSVTAIDFEKLHDQLLAEPICMIFLQVDVPEDQRMAYQHSQGSGFFSADGVDKLAGARNMAARLGIELDASMGAGDTSMDTFLNGVGCAVIVGNARLRLRGLLETIRVIDSITFGKLLFKLSELGPAR